jgi:hypothetical protein
VVGSALWARRWSAGFVIGLTPVAIAGRTRAKTIRHRARNDAGREDTSPASSEKQVCRGSRDESECIWKAFLAVCGGRGSRVGGDAGVRFHSRAAAVHRVQITQTFCGLHSWDLASRAWAARSHVKYGLGYTKGLRTLVVGDPPPAHPQYYVDHPPLESWIWALGMLALGTHDWSVRLIEVLISLPCLLLILLLLRKLRQHLRVVVGLAAGPAVCQGSCDSTCTTRKGTAQWSCYRYARKGTETDRNSGRIVW